MSHEKLRHVIFRDGLTKTGPVDRGPLWTARLRLALRHKVKMFECKPAYVDILLYLVMTMNDNIFAANEYIHYIVGQRKQLLIFIFCKVRGYLIGIFHSALHFSFGYNYTNFLVTASNSLRARVWNPLQ